MALKMNAFNTKKKPERTLNKSVKFEKRQKLQTNINLLVIFY